MLAFTRNSMPRIALDAIARPRLLQRLAGPTRGQVVVLDAPAGHGKTTLLVQMLDRLAQDGVTTAWHTATEIWSECDRFLASVAISLHSAGLPIAVSEEAVRANLPDIDPSSACNLILEALQNSEEPAVLVIDDYHKVESDELNTFIKAIINALPDHVSICISSRSKPRLDYFLLKSRGALVSLSTDDLRFSLDEAKEYFDGELSLEEVGRIVGRTEGWPAALHLIRLWLRDREDEGELVEIPAHPLSDLADYLAEQIFITLSAEVQSFLLKTSILERVSGGLARSLTGNDRSYDILESLERSGLMTFSVDSHKEWYRYHHMFRDFLLMRARRNPDSGGSQFDELHRRAAASLTEMGLLREGLKHALEVADPLFRIAHLEKLGGWRLALQGEFASLRLFRDCVLAEPCHFPLSALALAYVGAQDGRLSEARALLDEVQAGGVELDDGVETDVVLVDAILRVYEDREIEPAVLEKAHARATSGSGTHVGVQALTDNMLCISYFDQGDYEKCRLQGERATAKLRTGSSPFAENYTYLYVGSALLVQGRLREAELFFSKALEHAISYYGTPSNLEAISSVFLSGILCERGEIGEAEATLSESLARIEASEGWLGVFSTAYITAARLHGARGELAQAGDVLQRGIRVAERRGLPRLGDLLRARGVRLQIASNDLPSARSDWTSAGLGNALLRYSDNARDRLLHYELGACKVRLELLEGDFERAARDLDELKDRYLSGQEGSWCLELEVVEACLAAMTGDREAALRLFRRFCKASFAEGYRRLLMDEGVLALPLLELTSSSALSGTLNQREREFAHSLRDGLSGISEQLPLPSRAAGLGSDRGLSPRERDVLRALADGCSSKEIARALGIAESTVKTHRINLYKKLGSTTRSTTITAAREIGLLAQPSHRA